MTYLPAIIIIISALFLLIIPIAFGFSVLSAATIKTKRIVQIIATGMLAAATLVVGYIWLMFDVVGAGWSNVGVQLEFDLKHGQGEAGLDMVVVNSRWYVIGLWIFNLFIFYKDVFSENILEDPN